MKNLYSNTKHQKSFYWRKKDYVMGIKSLSKFETHIFLLNLIFNQLSILQRMALLYKNTQTPRNWWSLETFWTTRFWNCLASNFYNDFDVFNRCKTFQVLDLHVQVKSFKIVIKYMVQDTMNTEGGDRLEIVINL